MGAGSFLACLVTAIARGLQHQPLTHEQQLTQAEQNWMAALPIISLHDPATSKRKRSSLQPPRLHLSRPRKSPRSCNSSANLDHGSGPHPASASGSGSASGAGGEPVDASATQAPTVSGSAPPSSATTTTLGGTVPARHQPHQQHLHDNADHEIVERHAITEDVPHRYLLRSANLATDRFCTPACLLGLRFGLNMDPECPNVDLHCQIDGCDDHSKHRHPVDAQDVIKAIQQELAYGKIIDAMEPILGVLGSSSQLFRIMDKYHAYAFAAKGTSFMLEEMLEHEHSIYQHIWDQHRLNNGGGGMGGGNDDATAAPLLPLPLSSGFPMFGKGEAPVSGLRLQVPISFGVIRPLEQFEDVMYPLWPVKGQIEDGLACNTFLLMSYHGADLLSAAAWREACSTLAVPPGLQHDPELLVRACRQLLVAKGVLGGDVAFRNLLWCPHLNSIVVVDMEDAHLTTDARPAARD